MSDLRVQALRYLERHQVMTLATAAGDDLWAAALFYVNLDFSLFFLSAGHTRHARHLKGSSRVAATIQEDYRDWREIKGIQLEGTADRLHGAERAQAITLYGRKFPVIGQPVAAIAEALARVDWYRVTPARLYFIDNSKGFGHRDEVPLTD